MGRLLNCSEKFAYMQTDTIFRISHINKLNYLFLRAHRFQQLNTVIQVSLIDQ